MLFTAMKNYAKFSGRADRKEFWGFFLFAILLVAAASALDLMVSRGASEPTGVFFGIALVAIIIPNLALYARRLHDINRSGWWMLLGGVPIIGFIFFLVLGAVDGTDGPNRFDNPNEGGMFAGPMDQPPGRMDLGTAS